MPERAFTECSMCPPTAQCPCKNPSGSKGPSGSGTGPIGSICPGPNCNVSGGGGNGSGGKFNGTGGPCPGYNIVTGCPGGGALNGPVDQKDAGGAGGTQTGGGAGNVPGGAAGQAQTPGALIDPTQGAGGGTIASPYTPQMLDSFNSGDMKGACANAKLVLKDNPQDSQASTILYRSCWSDHPGKSASLGSTSPPPAANPGAGGVAPINDGQVQMLRSGSEPSPYFRPTTNFDPGLQLELGKIADFRKQGLHAQAAAEAKEGLKMWPTSAELLNAQAYALNKMKQYADALAAAEAALKVNPNDANAWANKAAALAGMGKKDEALAALKMAASLDPAFAEAYRRALAGDLAGLFGDDKKDFSIPHDWMLWGLAAFVLLLLLAIAYLFFKSTHPTIKKFKTFVKITPPPPLANANMATRLDGATRSNKLLKDQYEVGPQIGVGGMGEVFSGTDRSLDRKVAIKKMLPQLAAQPRERDRFVSEAKTVAALHHPNIVDIHAIVEEGTDIYLVFEYVAGKTLRDYIVGSGRLPFHDSIKIIKCIASALDFAHSKDIVHRDLKPANVMIDEHGMVKVMDFGLARSAQDAMTKLAMTNTIVGTPAYMAPEQDTGAVTKQSDVYALGVTLYEMLSGRLPFEGGAGAIMMQKLDGNYKPISQLVPSLPGGLDEFFAKALAPDYRQRIAGPKQFIEALDSITTPSPA